MLTITVSLAQVAYLSACGGFMLGVLALWIFVEVWKLIAKLTSQPTGKHRIGTRRSGNPDRYVYLMTTGARLTVQRLVC